ncbi:hypothetical protein QQS21_007414 [Conoideocrella luteorostrata]|uniref:Nucleoside phosphorylase domain-containing protein n=1 Tax=Conoideocrella luteorostrata TaxID=1105319 RepID=A0AAJ0CKW3_9HYPO|nr:hypothetical protein QQS21_007414 [Conoideocrella luteorostrata]
MSQKHLADDAHFDDLSLLEPSVFSRFPAFIGNNSYFFNLIGEPFPPHIMSSGVESWSATSEQYAIANYNIDTQSLWNEPNLRSWAHAESPVLAVMHDAAHDVRGMEKFGVKLGAEMSKYFPSICFQPHNRRIGEQPCILTPQEVLRNIAINILHLIKPPNATILMFKIVMLFKKAATISDWVDILKIISGHASRMIILLNLCTMSPEDQKSVSWTQIFLEIVDDLGQMETEPQVKILLLSPRRISIHSPKVLEIRPPRGLAATASYNAFNPVHIFSSNPLGFSKEWIMAHEDVRNLGVIASSKMTPRTRDHSVSFTVPRTEKCTKERKDARSIACHDYNDSDKGTQLQTHSLLTKVSATDTTQKKHTQNDDGSSPQALLQTCSLSVKFQSPGTTPGTSKPKSRNGFKIAIFCALTIEADAVEAIFDQYWGESEFGKVLGDKNAYTTGAIGTHNVVLVHMSNMGGVAAGSAASNCAISFPCIKIAFVVGICGGIPFAGPARREIVLGDIIIGDGLVKYTFGRQFPGYFLPKTDQEDGFERLNVEIRSLLTKIKGIRTGQRLLRSTHNHLAFLRQHPDLASSATYPIAKSDILFRSSYIHKHHHSADCEDWDRSCGTGAKACEIARRSNCQTLRCDVTQTVSRDRLSAVNRPQDGPAIHFGKVASGDKVMKSGVDRDMVAGIGDVVAFEMEGAGIWDVFPTLVIKGICDYADSHKCKDWQGYAATTAAAGLKAFLEEWVSHET